ncbi:MAG: glutaminyl-peptide cyclotransferase [Ferruginibacter sp.]|nr:glutaminyl-peptide cyclotransferase [Ferruginibacter sp.]
MKKYLLIATTIIFAACNPNDDGGDPPAQPSVSSGIAAPTIINASVKAAYEHDPTAYTQGLEFYKGNLYESTGDFENSSLRITDFKTGKVIKKHMMGSKEVFGEGITILNDTIYQLTWESHIVNVYHANDITKVIKTLKWPNEGWGITNNGTDLIVSTGSANIYFINPIDFRVKTTVVVEDNNGTVNSINELEYIDGFIYANIYGVNDYIVKIDPSSGHIVGKIMIPNLEEQYFKGKLTDPDRNEVLNGIAYDPTTKKLYITGKHWPKLFEVSLN